MKEQLVLKINDLDNYAEVQEKLLMLFDKVMIYYSEKDIKKLMKLINSMFVYWYLIYSEFGKMDKGEQDEK